MKRKLKKGLFNGFVFVIVALTATACSPVNSEPHMRGKLAPNVRDISLSDLPAVEQGEFWVDPYIKAAEQLQATGRTNATRQLMTLAQQNSDAFFDKRVAVLCRMVFAQRPGSFFERPTFGAPEFIGDPPGASISLNNSNNASCFLTWPLEPIEIVDGVPFLIVRGYSMHMIVDPHYMENYVRYCMTHCDWSAVQFAPKTRLQKKEALTKLLASRKWRQILEPYERAFLRNQIR